MIFNVTGGGGTGGTLTVTAPAGVTVTISKDGKVKTKTADENGVAVFKGLDTGTWTVTISDGSKTATADVVATTDYAVTMAYDQYLLKNADECADITGGWNTYSAGATGVSREIGSTGMVITATRPSGKWGVQCGYASAKKVDVTKWSELEVTGTNGRVILTPSYTDGTLIGTRTVAVYTGATADLTSVTGSYYVMAIIDIYKEGGGGTETETATISAILLK